jgi:hypothetical protein
VSTIISGPKKDPSTVKNGSTRCSASPWIHAVVTPLEEHAHVGTFPDQFLHGAASVDDFKILGVGENFVDIVAAKTPIGFRDDDEVTFGLAESTANRGSIALPEFEDLTSRSRRDFIAGSRGGVVVDHQDFIDDTRGLDLFNGCANRIPFVVGRQDHGDCFSVPHDQAGSATTYIWAAIGRKGEFR